MFIFEQKEQHVCCREISKLIDKRYGKHRLSTDGGTCYPQACKFLKLRHHLHSTYEKSIIERTVQYVKDRTECFDDYFPYRKVQTNPFEKLAQSIC
jgi:putative transposase